MKIILVPSIKYSWCFSCRSARFSSENSFLCFSWYSFINFSFLLEFLSGFLQLLLAEFLQELLQTFLLEFNQNLNHLFFFSKIPGSFFINYFNNSPWDSFKISLGVLLGILPKIPTWSSPDITLGLLSEILLFFTISGKESDPGHVFKLPHQVRP